MRPPETSPPTPAGGSAGRRIHYPPDERPVVEVLHTDGRWYRGLLHAWLSDGPGWHAVVSYHVGPGQQYYQYVRRARVRAVDETPRTPTDPGPP
jgi:hypothetical protein